MPLPREILERIDRVAEYHRATKHTHESIRLEPDGPHWSEKPNPFRIFEDYPKIPLPTVVLDAPVPTLALLSEGLSALPPERLHPSQDLQVLASWLYYANGITHGENGQWQRSCPSHGDLFPYEIYVAAFGIEGLVPGLYHYSLHEFCLRKIRQGPPTLAQILRGRPDLQFLKTVPAVLLVSTMYWRSAWRYRQRAYRYALQDAGHLTQNLITAANGLGIQTTTRLRMNDKSMRELIGILPDVPFEQAESVQAMVVWADEATQPLPLNGSTFEPLPPIPRPPLSDYCVPYLGIVAAHQECVAPGVAVRELRSPVTELSPLPPDQHWTELPEPDGPVGGRPLREVLLAHACTTEFSRKPISRDQLWTANRIAFRGGSHFPVLPDGPHVGLVRPLWIVNDVSGMEAGLWYYDPPQDRWRLLRRGDLRARVQYLSLDQPAASNASAACFMTANIPRLMKKAGPDAYRLAHLEAGIVGQRICLAAGAMKLVCCPIGAFYDDEVRGCLGMENTGWEVLYEILLGHPVPPQPPERAEPNGV